MDKRIWTTDETRAFLSAYIVRKDEFLHARKKKFAMQNVLLDLESQGVLSQPTTVDMLSTKFKNLVRAYKQSTDNNRRTGATPCNAPYADLMDEIFGDSPVISNNHSINLYGQPLVIYATPAEEQQTPSTSKSARVDSSSLQPSNGRNTRPNNKEKIAAMKLQWKKEAAEKKLKLLEDYTTKKIQKMEQAEQRKQKRHEEKMAMLKMYMESRNV